MKPQILIAAAASGSGKTTFTMGLLRCLYQRGIMVQPFKCGPDYIDPQFHRIAAQKTSINLDIWMTSHEEVQQIYAKYGSKAEVCITEGVMGLFDGFEKDKGSAADISLLLNIPVVLLVNAKSSAYSVAPLIYGFKHFNPNVKIAGVVFNQVASESHFSYLKKACDDAGVECFGYLAKCKGLEVPSRHLGLTLENEQQMNTWIEQAAKLVNDHVDIDKLLKACTTIFKVRYEVTSTLPNPEKNIVIAQDEAFNFIYQENISALKKLGNISFISPLYDKQIPENTDLLYLPGGYPELYAAQLSSNSTMLQSINEYARKGGAIFAECGGMMYLTQSLTMEDGINKFAMANVFPLECTMEKAHLHLGYRETSVNGDIWRGHEFHYSEIRNPEALPSIATQFSAKGLPINTALYKVNNVIAGYTHWYFTPNLLKKLKLLMNYK